MPPASYIIPYLALPSYLTLDYCLTTYCMAITRSWLDCLWPVSPPAGLLAPPHAAQH